MTENRKDNTQLQMKMDRYADMLFRLSYLRLENVQDAEDVVQETFYRYLSRTGSFESEEHEKAWLIKVTLNSCRKIWRSAWNRHRSGDCPESMEEKTAGDTHCPEYCVLESEENRLLLAAVMLLPLKYRDVIHLFYYEEMSIKEIAQITGRRESTVTSQLSRARELLRKSLKEEYDFA